MYLQFLIIVIELIGKKNLKFLKKDLQHSIVNRQLYSKNQIRNTDNPLPPHVSV